MTIFQRLAFSVIIGLFTTTHTFAQGDAADVNPKIIEFLSVIALLIVFEFFNLLIHPLLEKVTHHSPVLMLLALVLLAALLIPLHHKLEHWAVHKLIEKNKQSRLEAAKKTIEQLEKSV